MAVPSGGKRTHCLSPACLNLGKNIKMLLENSACTSLCHRRHLSGENPLLVFTSNRCSFIVKKKSGRVMQVVRCEVFLGGEKWSGKS